MKTNNPGNAGKELGSSGCQAPRKGREALASLTARPDHEAAAPAVSACRRPDLPLPRPARPKKRRKGKSLPAPRRSARLYIMVAPDSVHILRYLLEAEDNLGLMTVVDRRRGAIMLRFSPHQENTVRRWLEDIRDLLPFEGPLAVAAVRPDYS